MEASKTKISYYIHVLIMLFLFFGFRYLPTFGTVTEMGMQVLGVFLGMIYGWMFIDMLWPSVLGMIALGLTSYSNGVLGVLASGFSNKNVILIFFFFVFSQYLEYSGLSKYIAYRLLTMKALNGKPWALCFMIIFTSYLLGIFINTYAVIFLVWAIIYGISEITGYEKQAPIIAFLLVGVVQSAGISGTVMPYQVFPALCLNSLETATGLTVSTGMFIFFNLIISFLGILAYYLFVKICIHPDVSKMSSISAESLMKEEEKDCLVFGKKQLIAAVIMVAFLIIILVPSFLPKTSAVVVLYKKIGDQGVLALLLVITCALRMDGKPLSDMTYLINKGVNWSLMFLLMATFTIGDAVNSGDAGIIQMINNLLSPIFHGMSPVVFLAASMLLLGLITQIAHNLVLATVFVPILSTLAIESGLGEKTAILVTLGLAVVLLQALVTPAASNRGALIYGSDWIGKHNALIFGTSACFCAIAVTIVLGIPLGMLMF